MLICPIGVFNKSNSISKSTIQPAFKRQNYARVFIEQFDKPLSCRSSLERMFKELLQSAQFKNVKGINFFFNEFANRGVFGNLLRLVRPGTHDEYDKIINASKEGISILTTQDEQPIINIINNGRYEEETFLSKFKKGNMTNVNIVFRELDNDADKIILFGADYDGDVFVARGTVDIPAQRMETFYNDQGAGRLKQKATYSPSNGTHIVENFHKDGTKWSSTEEFFDDLAWVIRSTLNGDLKR